MSMPIVARPRRRVRRLLIPAAGLLGCVLAVGAAWAYWAASGSGATAASTATLNPPTAVQAAGGSAGTVTLTWTPPTISPAAVAPSGYYVTRVSDADGGPAAACGTAPDSLIMTAQCTDTAVPDGTYHYIVTAAYRSWTAAGASSNSIAVTNTRPGVSVALAAGQSDPTNAAPITFAATFDEPVTGFTSSGVVVGGSAPGTPTAAVTGSGTDYTITVSGMTGTGTVTVSVAANAAQDSHGAGNTASNTVSATYDVTAPVAGSPALAATHISGTNPVYLSAEAVTFSDAASDTDSGIAAVSYYYCTTTSGSCTAATGTLVGSSTTPAGGYPAVFTVPSTMTNGSYRAVAVVTDNAGNTSTSAATVFAVDTLAPTLSRPTVNGHS